MFGEWARREAKAVFSWDERMEWAGGGMGMDGHGPGRWAGGGGWLRGLRSDKTYPTLSLLLSLPASAQTDRPRPSLALSGCDF